MNVQVETIPVTVLRWETTESAGEFVDALLARDDAPTAWVRGVSYIYPEEAVSVLVGGDVKSIHLGDEIVIVDYENSFVRRSY